MHQNARFRRRTCQNFLGPSLPRPHVTWERDTPSPVDPKTTFLDTDLNAAMYVYLVPVSVSIHTLYNATIPEDEIRNNNYDAVGMPVWVRVIIM